MEGADSYGVGALRSTLEESPVSEQQAFEVSTFADADVTIGPGNPAHPDHAAWLAQQDQDDEQADEPEIEQEKS